MTKRDEVARAITALIDEAKLGYEFCPGSYTMSTLHAALHVEQVYLLRQQRQTREQDE
jgi:hypothetical protein